MGMFKRGYEAVREEKQRQDENREKAGKALWRFFLSKDGDEAQVRFLTEEPINFEEHTVKTVRNGKEAYDNVICTRNLSCGCALCNSGDRPSFKGAYLMYDRRPSEYTDKNGKKQTSNGQLRLYVQGARVLSQLDRLSARYGLTSRDYIITRAGSGTSTTYMFDRTDDTGKLTEAEIKNMLPEKLREEFDGTQDSLYDILQNQLEMLISGSNESEEEEDKPSSYDKRLVNMDDEDGELPFTPSSTKPKTTPKLGFKSKKPVENSSKTVKALYKRS